MNPDDRRKYKRFKNSSNVLIQIDNATYDVFAIKQSRMKDISGKGMLIERSEPLDVGSTVKVRFMKPNSLDFFDTKARVMRIRPFYEVAIEFIDIEQKNCDSLDFYLRGGILTKMNSNKKTSAVTMYISSNWEIIKDIETRVSSYFSEDQKDICDATMIVITELVENAVKYGSPLPGASGIKFNFEIRGANIEISISNSIFDEKNLKCLREHIDEIQRSANPQELYTRRLQELINDEDKSATGGLGLYRIAHEAKFKIEYNISDNILTVIARRPIYN